MWGAGTPQQQSAKIDEPTMHVASWHPNERCDPNDPDFDSVVIKSVCREVDPPQAYLLKKDPKSGEYYAPTWKKKTDWPEVHTLPPVVMRAPNTRRVGTVKPKGNAVHVANAVSGTQNAPGTQHGIGNTAVGKIAIELARYGATYTAQMGATAALAATPAAPAAPILGPWIGCTETRYAFTAQDFYQKERWDLHPEIALNNRIYWTKMCSPLGPLFRAIEAETLPRKLAALSGFLTWLIDPTGNLIGQIGPATPSMYDAVSGMHIGTWFKFGGFKPRKPYHDGPWVADTHG
jgi:hypothetical protein